MPNFVLIYRKQIIFGLIIFLTATIAFAAGYLIGRDVPAPIVIELGSGASSTTR